MAKVAKLKIDGLSPAIDGVYDVPADFNLGELFFIEQTVGLKSGELDEASRKGSVGLLTCMAAIALKRAGKASSFNEPLPMLWDARDENIDVEEVEEDPDAGRPLASTPTPNGPESEPGAESSTGAM